MDVPFCAQGIEKERGGDVVGAAALYKQSATQCYPRGMCNYAIFRLKGQGGIQQDKSAAFNLFEQAANLGFARAMFNIALMYERGDDITEDKPKALEWYKKAADLGDKDSVMRYNKHKADPTYQTRKVEVKPIVPERHAEPEPAGQSIGHPPEQFAPSFPVDSYRGNLDSTVTYMPGQSNPGTPKVQEAPQG